MKELPVPEAAISDSASVEMLRVWIASGRLWSSLNIGIYRDQTKIPEGEAWGKILADTARHLARGMNQRFGDAQEPIIQEILDAFSKELAKPTSPIDGGLV
jgi:hypothetical protein